jgi:hypothetical protein
VNLTAIVDEIGDRFEQKVTVAAHDRIIGRVNPAA